MRKLLGVFVAIGHAAFFVPALLAQEIPPPPLPVTTLPEPGPAELPLPEPPFNDELLPPTPATPPSPESALLPIPQVPLPFPPEEIPAVEPARPGKLRVAVVESAVALDGVARPELARAVADAFVSDFLKNGSVEVLDLGGRAVADMARAGESAPPCDVAFIPTVVGQHGDYHMTVRRVALPSGKIEQLYEDRATGSLPGLMEMTGRMARQLVPPPSPEPPKSPPPPPVRAMRIRAWMSEPAPPVVKPRPAVPPKPKPRASTPAPRPLRTMVFDGNRQMEFESIGRLVSVNPEYSFCVIRPSNARRNLPAGTKIFIQVEGLPRPTVSAVVSRLERGQIIADYETIGNPTLRPGALVYQWVPVEESSFPPGLEPVPESASRR